MIIKKIAKSIQGRGILSGKPCIVIEFGGGGLEAVTDKTVDEIVEIVSELRGSYVSLCGCDPLRETEADLKALFEALKIRGKFVTLETEGRIFTDINFDFITITIHAGMLIDREMINYYFGLRTKVQILFTIYDYVNVGTVASPELSVADQFRWIEKFVKEYFVIRKKKIPLLFYPDPNMVAKFNIISQHVFNASWLKQYNHRVMLDISKVLP